MPQSAAERSTGAWRKFIGLLRMLIVRQTDNGSVDEATSQIVFAQDNSLTTVSRFDFPGEVGFAAKANLSWS